MKTADNLKIISGNSNRPLAEAIARRMSVYRSDKVTLAKARVERFNDKEIFVEIYENVRGEDVFIIQPTSHPANDNLMELLIMTDALKRSSARRITAVIPYFGYARQDRKSAARTPISAKLVANLITKAGVDRVLTMDLHAGQIQGFFDIPTDNLFASPVFALDIKHHMPDHDAAAALDLADDVHDLRRTGPLTALVDDREVGLQPLSHAASPQHAADIGGDDNQLIAVQILLDVLGEHRRGEEVVHWNIEKALNLRGMQVHG